MAISDYLKRNIAKTARFKEVQEEMEIHKKIEERQKSSNERELERFHEEEREKTIKKNLEEFRVHRQKESMETTVLGGKNMFKDSKNIFAGHKSILTNNNKLLSMKTVKQKGMFFK